MVVKTAASMRTGTRVDTKPEAELELLASLVALPTFGSLFGSCSKAVGQIC